MSVQEFLQDEGKFMPNPEYKIFMGYGKLSSEHRYRLTCVDGFSISIQASRGHRSTPQEDKAKFYSHVEAALPSVPVEDLNPYAEDDEDLMFPVYNFVPVEVIDTIVAQHGGIKC